MKVSNVKIINLIIMLSDHAKYKYWYPFTKNCTPIWSKDSRYKLSNGTVDIPFVKKKS